MADKDAGTFDGLEVGKISGKFFVPRYQRGYRWTEIEVTRLLEDIRGSEGSTYYLQPIVVKPLGDNRWELIDGQQRLTTLALIVRYFKAYVPMAEVKYTIEYETRPLSAEFLLEPTKEKAGENIDFFHMFTAWQAIGAWLDRQDDASTSAFEIYSALSRRVKVIWYEAPETTDSIELFTRLNVGRIPLTDAELVKALLLSLSREVDGTDRALSVAAEWDAIERDLRNPELWAFLTARSDDEATHISLLLDTIADQLSDRLRARDGKDTGERKPLRGRDRSSFHTFETLRRAIVQPGVFACLLCDHDVKAGQGAAHLWDHVVDLHSLLTGWFEEREPFHKIGYLTACGLPFGSVLGLAVGATRRQFVESLDKTIASGRRVGLNLTLSALRDLAYGEDDAKIRRALLLMNVEAVRKLTNSTERFSFHTYAARSWSLEHIHAQNSEGLNTVEQWTEWLRQHRDALSGMPNLEAKEVEDLSDRIDETLAALTLEKFQELETELRAIYSSPDVDVTPEEHALSNLALLEKNDNSTLNNWVFEAKRQLVLGLDRKGSYIPICTRNVFLKYYTERRAQQLHFWGPQDRQAYMTAIERELTQYLLPETKVADAS
ncbi:DUF262 domain-containing protein [Pengzhenrongella frigida]|uniref:DUF262 domain-containing protein n=1 Tax=Pengzhenrongella frigida TaxID=1259133 RepID=A0A4Q5N562_9MICO|nr:DUF262 domain-containing protein [Cellulomonas sp. HLT2-17]RYV51907.1 DUF262 domain-containing protein [Cellulomonas sp. HLT2-17]